MQKLLISSLFAAPVLAFGLPALAAPQVPAATSPSLVEQVRADCVWVNNKWTYRKGDKVLVCKPNRPRGAGWSWYSEGNRTGWYNKRNREWHHKVW